MVVDVGICTRSLVTGTAEAEQVLKSFTEKILCQLLFLPTLPIAMGECLG